MQLHDNNYKKEGRKKHTHTQTQFEKAHNKLGFTWHLHDYHLLLLHVEQNHFPLGVLASDSPKQLR